MKMDSPANYRIIVQGRLEADWAERVGGMAITSTDANGEVGAMGCAAACLAAPTKERVMLTSTGWSRCCEKFRNQELRA